MPTIEVSAHCPSGGFPDHLATHRDTGGLLPLARPPAHCLLWLLAEGNSPEDGLGDAAHWNWIRSVPKGHMLRLGPQ